MNFNNNPYVLSIDAGTSSVRSMLFDASGREVEGIGTRIPYALTRTADGGEFIDLDEFFQIVLQAIDQAVEEARKKSIAITAVACCTFWHNAAGVDAQGNACTPLLSWSDVRPGAMLPRLRQRLDEKAYTRRTGCPLHASYLPAKILWLRQEAPEAAKRARYWMSAGEYFYYKILGKKVCSYSMASASGLLDSIRCVWDEEALAAAAIEPEQLSALCDAADGQRGMAPEFARRWPMLRDAVWFPALGDGACSNIGGGCASPERFALMVGTSGALRAAWRGAYRESPNGLWCYRIDKTRPIQGGALSNGGNLFKWLKGALNLPPIVELNERLPALPPDGHGLMFLPFLSGQRSPRWNPDSRGTLHGLRLSTQPIQILQAGLEAVAYRFKLIHDLLAPNFPPEHTIIATGGGLLKSPAWIQIIADVLGRPVSVSHVAEASSRGAALMALESLGALRDVAEADPMLGETYWPNMKAHEIYQAALRRHLDLEKKMMNDE
ncbi:MAG: gluconokinase [Candidatus Omnitrophota bacterium]